MLLFEQESLRWGLLGFEAFIGLVLILASKSQPFPLPSRRFGWIVLSVALILWSWLIWPPDWYSSPDTHPQRSPDRTIFRIFVLRRDWRFDGFNMAGFEHI